MNEQLRWSSHDVVAALEVEPRDAEVSAADSTSTAILRSHRPIIAVGIALFAAAALLNLLFRLAVWLLA